MNNLHQTRPVAAVHLLNEDHHFQKNYLSSDTLSRLHQKIQKLEIQLEKQKIANAKRERMKSYDFESDSLY